MCHSTRPCSPIVLKPPHRFLSQINQLFPTEAWIWRMQRSLTLLDVRGATGGKCKWRFYSIWYAGAPASYFGDETGCRALHLVYDGLPAVLSLISGYEFVSIFYIAATMAELYSKLNYNLRGNVDSRTTGWSRHLTTGLAQDNQQDLRGFNKQFFK